jgi:hypothetical protein
VVGSAGHADERAYSEQVFTGRANSRGHHYPCRGRDAASSRTSRLRSDPGRCRQERPQFGSRPRAASQPSAASPPAPGTATAAEALARSAHGGPSLIVTAR